MEMGNSLYGLDSLCVDKGLCMYWVGGGMHWFFLSDIFVENE
jgi:hypothetical protein